MIEEDDFMPKTEPPQSHMGLGPGERARCR
jgi:hypothetical protein